MNTIMNFTGTEDTPSTKASFVVAPYTLDGPANPHSATPAPGATVAHTSIRFPGKGKSDYGDIVCNSLLHMLEHFAAERPPEFPTTGQLWYDMLTGYMRVWSDTVWQPTHILVSSVDPVPPGPISPPSTAEYVPLPIGTLWLHPTTGQLNRYTGTAWHDITADYLPVAGGMMAGDIDMNGTHSVVNLRTPSLPGDAISKSYFDSQTSTLVTSSYMWPIANVIDLQNQLDGINSTLITLNNEVASNTATMLALQTDVDDKLSKTNGVVTGTVDVQGVLSINSLGYLRINAPAILPTDAVNKAYVDALSGGSSTVASINDLTDVDIGVLAPQDILSFSAGTGQWVNSTADSLGLAPLSHTTDPMGAHEASAISFTPPVGMVSANTQDALVSLYDSKLSTSGGNMSGSIYMNGFPVTGLTLPINPGDAASKSFVERMTLHPRLIKTVSVASTLTVPVVRPSQNNLQVFLNGVKLYQTNTPQQTVDLDHDIIALTSPTGIPVDDIVYTADITSTTRHQIVGVSGSTITLVGNLFGWYTPGTTFTIEGSTGNNGSYTVASGGATYNSTARNTTIVLTTTPPSGTIDGFAVITGKVRHIGIRGRLMSTYTGLVNRMLSISEPVQSASNSGSSVVIIGDYTTVFVAGTPFTLSGTLGATDDGEYITVSSSYSAGNTTIVTTVAPPDDMISYGVLTANTAVEYAIDISQNNLTLVQTGVGGDSTSISIVDTGTHPLMSSLSQYVAIRPALPGITGAYIEDMRSVFRNKDDATVIDSLLMTSPITGTVEVIALTPSMY